MCYNSKYIKKSLIPLFKTQRSDYQERNTSVTSSAQQRLNKKRRSFYRSPGLLLIFLCGLALIHLLTLSGLIRPEILWDKTTVDTRSLLLAGIFTILILAAMIWSIRFRVIPALRAGRLGTGAEILCDAISVYFALQLAGCIFGSLATYRIVGGIIYMTGLIVSIRCASVIYLDRKRQRAR